MPNHNILITNPQKEQSFQFRENVTREECEEFVRKYVPVAKGWSYQIVNLNRKNHTPNPDWVVVTGISKDGEFIHSLKAGHKTNNGWFTIKMAKRDLRRQGASFFVLEKVWCDGESE